MTFSVTDDGDGFDPSVTPMGAGLVNMRDRVDALGGTVALHSEPGDGATLRGTIPTAVVSPAPEDRPWSRPRQPDERGSGQAGWEEWVARPQASVRVSGSNADFGMKAAAPAVRALAAYSSAS